jgi:formylglycine-generating enzyme required for sulfatase activity
VTSIGTFLGRLVARSSAHGLTILGSAMLFVLPSDVRADDRIAVPTASAQRVALETIKTVFSEEYAAAKGADGKILLAQRLFKQAQETSDDAAARYVLLTQVRDLAVELGDITLIGQTIEELGKLYQVDPVTMKVDAFQTLVAKPHSAAVNEDLASALLSLMEEAIARERYLEAEQFAKSALAAAIRTRDAQLVKMAKARVSECTRFKHEFDLASTAEATLAKVPDDRDANLVLGKYLCFVRRDWRAGLPYLAKGGDEELRVLAGASVAASSEPAALTELGDRWWDAAERAKTKDRALRRRGARHWYSLATFGGLTGLARTKIEKRLTELGGAEGAAVLASNPTAGTGRVSAGKLPSAAIAPFDAVAAKKHQVECSTLLQLPAELTNSIGLRLMLIPPGEFEMGDVSAENRLPVHPVRISHPFYIGAVEVTQEQWHAVMGANPAVYATAGSKAAEVGGIDTRRFPIESISYAMCLDFCTQLSALPAERAAGRMYRLPTEAEWEYVYRAGTTTRFWFGSDHTKFPDHEWIGENAGKHPHPVAEKRANPFGIYDLDGNVREFCADSYAADFYARSPLMDPLASGTGSSCVVRGLSFLGSWWDVERREFRTDDWSSTLGVRVVCTSLAMQSTGAAFPRRDATGDPATVSKSGPGPANLDQRTVALWVLGQRGFVRIGRIGEYGETIRSADALPVGDFNVLAVDLSNNKKVNDDDLKQLRGLTGLERLGLDGTNVTDAGLIHLLTLERLRDVALCATQITDAGIVTLQKLPKLERLWVRGTPLTDVGVDRMARFPALLSVDLRGVKAITPDDLPRRLQTLKLEGFHASGLTDMGIFRLNAQPKLNYLSITDSTCSDASLASLVRFSGLVELSLENDKQITDVGLLHLTKLPRLKALTIRNMNVSDAAVRRFQADKPNCKVLR